jgi:hypothetical protein
MPKPTRLTRSGHSLLGLVVPRPNGGLQMSD